MKRRIITIIVAVLLAMFGTVAVLLYVNQADARALEGMQAETVLVATKPIPAGTTGKAAKTSLRQERMPADAVPTDAVSEIDDDLEKLVTSADIAQGQLLTRTMLVKKSERDEIVLPDGKLAVTIEVQAGSQGEDQLKPGFKVAVFDTFTVAGGEPKFTPNGERLKFGDDKNQATRLLLPKVEVIGVTAEKKGDKAGSGFGKYLVTVAVTQSEAERLIHAMQTGTLSLAQVNHGSVVKPGKGVDNNELFEG